MNSENIFRYSRQTMLPGFGAYGQKKLAQAKVLVIGAGGLGCPAIQALAAMGVGTLGISDGDRVDLTNLPRQTLYSNEDVGQFKVVAAEKKIKSLQPEIKLIPIPEFITAENAEKHLTDFDFILDGTDNLEIKLLIHDLCLQLKKPLSHGAAIQFEGQTTTILPGGPCYRCFFQEIPADVCFDKCEDIGVFSTLPTTIGLIQASEAAKWILGIGDLLSGKIFIYNVYQQNGRTVAFEKRAGCICSKN